MKSLTLDSQTRAKLLNLVHALELCDEYGNVLAYVTPAADPTIYTGKDSPHSDEELRRREQESETYSTAELLARLETL